MASSSSSSGPSSNLIDALLARNLDHVVLDIFRQLDFSSLYRAVRANEGWRRFILDNLERLSSKDGKDTDEIDLNLDDLGRKENDGDGRLTHLLSQMTDREVLGLEKDRLSSNVCLHEERKKANLFPSSFDEIFPAMRADELEETPSQGWRRIMALYNPSTFDRVHCQCLNGYSLLHKAAGTGKNREEKIILIKNGSKDGSRATKEVLTLWEKGERFSGEVPINNVKDVRSQSFKMMPFSGTNPLMINGDRAFIVAAVLLPKSGRAHRRSLHFNGKVVFEGVLVNLRTETVVWRKHLGDYDLLDVRGQLYGMKPLNHCKPFFSDSFCGIVLGHDERPRVIIHGLTEEGNLTWLAKKMWYAHFYLPDQLGRLEGIFLAVGSRKLAVVLDYLYDGFEVTKCWLIGTSDGGGGQLAEETFKLNQNYRFHWDLFVLSQDRFLVGSGKKSNYNPGVVSCWDLGKRESTSKLPMKVFRLEGLIVKGASASGNFWILKEDVNVIEDTDDESEEEGQEEQEGDGEEDWDDSSSEEEIVEVPEQEEEESEKEKEKEEIGGSKLNAITFGKSKKTMSFLR